MSLESRVTALESEIPGNYQTYDTEGRVVVNSNLPASEWIQQAMEPINSLGREEEKAVLRDKLAHSVGPDSGGGRLYEVVKVLDAGPRRTENPAESEAAND